MTSQSELNDSGQIRFTPQQLRAIRTVGQSVVVTAAAGSGKTAVLAERCAYLVCDLPADQRCAVDALCVVTFTEAAAAEMKSRILEALRGRARKNPSDAYLRTQAALIDTAQISTLHAFCLWMLRRWFSEASVDPSATLLQAEEARLLRTETVDALFEGLYDEATDLGRGFVRLVDEYGLGRDEPIAEVVLKLADFVSSLPDPQGWLDGARHSVGQNADATLQWFDDRLGSEIERQREQVQAVADFIQRELPVAALYGEKLEPYAEALAGWSTSSDTDAVRRAIAEFKVSAGSGVKGTGSPDDPKVAQVHTARDLFKRIKEHLFEKQLQPLARFSRDEAMAGLRAVEPHVATLCELTRVFAERYRQAKADLDVLDFGDLERGAYELLTQNGTHGEPSPVALALGERFAHVLVDEFQDINPLQAEILRLVSREGHPDLPGNLFCVGDVKQSIYRFRLAEPAVLQDRVDRADRDTSQAISVRLQDNFRSVPRLIEGLNLLFEKLMSRRFGGVDYDDTARLRPGLPDPPDADRPESPPIELHVLERRLPGNSQGDDSEDQPQADPTDPAQWESIEREALLIGRMILDQRARAQQADLPVPEWQDVAVLMRATRHTAQPMAEMFRRLGIPAQADAGEALLGSTEVQDVMALLHVLDNPLQDIPLAAVLRSGVMGMALNEDDLVALRCHDRDVPFHQAVRDYAGSGGDADLKARLGRMLNRLDRWRGQIRLRPLAEVLWRIYQESGYLAQVGGLQRGLDRRGNLLALHGRARQFGGFKRQGLHRFLRFVDSLADSGQDLMVKSSNGRAGDAVRIMSIHGSKGLEFDTVYLADLGKRFNLGDKQGRMIFDRVGGIGLRVVEPERMIEYPSVAHLRVADSIEAATRDEEMRVLYVALTRAKRRLVLVGSADLNGVEATARLWSRIGTAMGSPAAPPSRTPLDWLIPALATASTDRVAWVNDGPGAQPAEPLCRVWYHDGDDIDGWDVPTESSVAECKSLAAAAALKALPADEPMPDDPAEVTAVLDRLSFTYPHLAAASVAAVMGASQAKREVDPFEERHRPVGQPAAAPIYDRPKVLESSAKRPSPQRRGTVTHQVLESWDFSTPAQQAVDGLVQAGDIESADASQVDLHGLDWFAGTDLAEQMRQAGDHYRREVRFVSTEPAARFDPALEGMPDERVLIRGIVDGVLVHGDTLDIVDFKTDAVSPDEVAARAQQYAMQMGLYASAIGRIWKKPVGRGLLVFLSPRRIIEIGIQEEPNRTCT